MFRKKDGEIDVVKVTIAIMISFIVFRILFMSIMPQYTVWEQGLAGQA